MERYEFLNLVAKPADLTMQGAIDVLKFLNLYEPVRRGIYQMVKKNMKAGFVKNNKLEVIGMENLPDKSGVIVAANHQSWLDVQVLGSSCKRDMHFVAKSDFLKWPILSKFIEMTESVYVARGGDEQGLADIIDKLKKGWLVMIFPEGTIPGEEKASRKELDPRTGLLRGKSGVVRLAIVSGVPVVPVGISGTGQALPPEAYPRFEMPPIQKKVPITIRYGKPIYFKNYSLKNIDKKTLRMLTHKVMKEISKLVDYKRCFVPIKVPMKKPDLSGITFIPKGLKRKSSFGFLGLHGFTSHISCISVFEPRIKKFKIPYRFPILRGHGSFPNELIGVKYTDWYNDAENALLELSKYCKKVIVAGLSMGGLLTIELGIKHPKLVSNCILIAPALKFADPLSGMAPFLSRIFKYWDSPNAYNDEKCKAKNNWNYPVFATDAFISLYEYAKKIEKMLPLFNRPVLILQSKKDTVVAPSSAEIIKGDIKSRQKEIVYFRKTNHEMLLDIESDAVMDVMEDYLKDILG